MDKVALMKRMDTKFVITKSQLYAVLETLTSDYTVLEIGANRLMSYISDYYDTDSKKFYLDHHNKIAKRTKIRIRNYIESGLFFLEIKQKDSKGNTLKKRIAKNAFEENLSSESMDFIENKTGQRFNLNKTLSNGFQRVTLVNIELKERVTLDLNLSYNSTVLNEALVIVELKQEKFNRQSPMVKALRKMAIYPYSISKYCIGLATLFPEIKQNHFKQKFRTINKLTA